MKYNIFYGRKLRVAQYNMLEIGLTMEFDSAITVPDSAFHLVKSQVDKWIEDEKNRLLEESIPRPDRRR